jgi:DNA modification methylase
MLSKRGTGDAKVRLAFAEDFVLNAVYYSDCLLVMSSIPSESVDLVYMDPPFGSNRTYTSTRKAFGSFPSFDDRWTGGMANYVSWMKERIIECERVLRKTGSIFLHCDPHSSHYLKAVMDELFGMTNFRNEIIWKRQSSHNDSKQGSRHFGRIHDVILFYSKTDELKWHPQYRPYTKEYTDKVYRFLEPKTSRMYALGDLGGIGGADKSCPNYTFLGFTRYWRYAKRRMEKLWRDGRIVQTSPRTQPKLKRYLDEMKGLEYQDLWDDINPVGNGERVHYPTQKPLKLLERIIRSSTDVGDIVLDPFCGSGTSAVVCENLRRKWIAIDSSISACRVTKKRLRADGVKVGIISQYTR